MRSQTPGSGGLFVVSCVLLLQALVYGARFVWPLPGVCNKGAAWGLPLDATVLLALFAGGLFFFFMQWRKEKEYLLHWMWAVFLAAGMSNVLERIVYGCIFDYLHFSGRLHFNIADVLLTGCGIFFIGFQCFRYAQYKKSLALLK